MGTQPGNSQRSGSNTPNSCGKCEIKQIKNCFCTNINNLGMC